MEVNKIVKVTWKDSKFYSHEWLSTMEASSLDVGACETYGLLLFKNSQRVIIAQSLNVDCETYHNLMIIPTVCIESMEEVK